MNLKIKVTITAPTAVELTDASDSGKTYVMHGGVPVEASNQTSLVKNGIGTFAIPEGNAWAADCAVVKSDDSELTQADVTNFNANKVFTVKLQATNKVRIGVDVENKTESARTINSYVGTYEASSDILLGTATITLGWDSSANKAYVDGVVYAADTGNKAGATASAINYYYSLSPEKTSAAETESYAYGTVSSTLTAA